MGVYQALVDSDGQGINRILLVDDNALNQRVASALLRRRGYTVTVVSNGRDAVEMSGRQRFDAVLMDIEMPGIDGFSAAAQIRRRERATGSRVPIIAMTAHHAATIRARCREVGIDDELEKPLEPGQLYSALAHCPLDVADQADHVVFNEASFLERCEGDHELADLLIETFLQTLDDELDGIRTALERLDATAVRIRAHGLKGAAANMSAEYASGIARSLELLAQSGDLTGAPILWERLLDAIDELRLRLIEHPTSDAPLPALSLLL